MPDGDRFPHLKPRYNTVYKQVCQGQLEPQTIARNIVTVLRKDIQDAHETPIQAIKCISAQHSLILLRLRSGIAVDWCEAIQQLADTARTVTSKSMRSLVERAGNENLDELHKGDNCGDMHTNLILRFLLHLYSANFADCLPMIPQHFDNATPEAISAQLETIQPYVEAELARFAEEISRKGSDAKLHLSRRNMQPINLDAVVA